MLTRNDNASTNSNQCNNFTHLTHFTHLVTSQKAAFTLAEVLITLAIIGIVAAITIPSLIQSYKKTEYSTKLKKFYSTMQQAIQMSEIDNGPLESWEFSPMEQDEDGNYLDSNFAYTESWAKKYILPYIQYSKYVSGYYETISDEKKEHMFKIYMSDGSIVYIRRGTCMDIDYDVNGGSSKETGIDLYAFTCCFGSSGSEAISKGFNTYLYNNVTSRQNALERCKTQPLYCSNLLRYDNWEFKDDYPYKL